MKKLIVALCLIGATISSSAFAWNNGYRGYNGYRGPVYVNNYGYNNNWVAPALAGAVVGGLVARSYYAPPPVYVQQPVYVQPQPTYYYQQPAPYNQQPANPPPFGYHWSYLLDGGCNCYRWAILPDGS